MKAEGLAKTPSKVDQRTDLRQALILVTAAFLLAWAPRLGWGFWTDEAGTFWMAAAGWREAIARCWNWTGQSVLYGVLESAFVIPGRFQEVFLRVPSLAGIATAAWFTYKLAERYIRPGSGAVAMVALVCLPDVVAFGTSARPYALAMAAAVASSYFLLRWRELNTWSPAIGYGISAALLVNLHYLATFLFLPHLIYVVYVKSDASSRTLLKNPVGHPLHDCRGSVSAAMPIQSRDSHGADFRDFQQAPSVTAGIPIGWKLPLVASIAIPLAALPVVGHLRSTVERAGTFAGAAKPDFLQLLQFCFPQLILLAIGLGLGMAWLTARKLVFRSSPLPVETILLLVLWLVAAPVAFFLGATFTSNSIFAARYLLFVVPALALLIAWFASALERPHARRLLMCALFAAPVLHPAMLISAFGPAPESWREPLAVVRAFSGGDGVPVMVASGLVESGRGDWKSQNPAASKMFAALSAYPLPNPTYPLPYQFSNDVARQIEDRVGSLGWRDSPVMLLCDDSSPLKSWFAGEMKRRGYRVEEHTVNRLTVTRATPP